LEKFSFDSGIYLLELFLYKPYRIEIGALGKIIFPPGYYYYAGTAQKNLNARLERYQQGPENKHWHIDYFLEEALIKRIFASELDREAECQLARNLRELPETEIIARELGSSDCSCESHLIYSPEPLSEEEIEDVMPE